MRNSGDSDDSLDVANENSDSASDSSKEGNDGDESDPLEENIFGFNVANREGEVIEQSARFG